MTFLFSLSLHHSAEAANEQENNWIGRYFTSEDISVEAPPAKDLNFKWGFESPNSLIPKDHFFASYTKKINGGQDYFVQAYADDRIRVSANGKNIIDRWTDGDDVVNRGFITGLPSGEQVVQVDYMENTRHATLMTDVVPFGNWVAYYYNNANLSGVPTQKKTLQSDGTSLSFDHGFNAPMSGINSDHYSASFSTAKRIAPGNYVIRTRADDGVRVYIDNKLVLDQWKLNDGKEFAKTISISNTKENQDIHEIRVEYVDNTRVSKLNFSLTPEQEEIPTNEWLAQYYPNMNMSGAPYTIGGKNSSNKISSIDYKWNFGSPLTSIPSNQFSAKFMRKITGGQDYFVQAYADDRIRVSTNGKNIIDRWTDGDDVINRGIITGLPSGEQVVQVNYMENTRHATIIADVVPLGNWVAYYYNNANLSGAPARKKTIKSDGSSLSFDHGFNAPMSGIKSDYYSASFSTAKRIAAGNYVLRTRADDGVRVYIDNKLVLDQWKLNDGKEYATTVTISNTKENQDIHQIRVEYVDNTRVSKLDFSLTPEQEEIPANEWLAQYYPNMNMSGASYTIGGKNSSNTISSINYKWNFGSPLASIPSNQFSAKFLRKIAGGQDYFVQAYADDRIRVSANGQNIIDRWTDGDDVVNRGTITNLPSGEQVVQVNYSENTRHATLMADVVPFGDWVAYYYNNSNLSGVPAQKKTINSDGTSISFDHGFNAPMSGIKSDYYSASFSTAKRIAPGNYVLRTRADDGVRVYIDNKLVLDQWKLNDGKEYAKTVSISNTKEKQDVHEIRVEYVDNTRVSKLDFSLVPEKDEIPTNEWIAQYYPNMNMSGTSYTVGGKNSSNTISSINYKWNFGSPLASIPSDRFSAKFLKKINGGKDYFVQAFADDRIRVSANGQNIIDRWTDGDEVVNKGIITNLPSGEQVVQVDYMENTRHATLMADVVPFGEWVAYYYNNANLSGAPAQKKTIKSNGTSISFDHGFNAPISGINSDHYSASFTTTKRIAPGNYVLRTRADDGVRVYIDDELVLDQWTLNDGKEFAKTISISNTTENQDIHEIRVEYVDNTRVSKLDFSLNPEQEEIPTNEWIAQYYPNKEMSGPSYTVGGKTSSNKLTTINYNWGFESPMNGIPTDNFSAVYRKKLSLSEDKEYILRLTSDDGVRVYIDNKRIIDSWEPGSYNYTEIVNLSKGTHEIKVEYYENTRHAQISVDFSEVIKEKFYYSTKYNYPFSHLVDKQMLSGSPKADGAGAIPASRELVEYYANPANFQQNSDSYLQFLLLSRHAGLNAAEVNDKILKGKGILDGMAEAFISAGKKHNINEVYLIAHALHETGNGTSTLAKGVKVNGKTVYNMYGIKAFDDNPVESGSQHAYSKGWDTPEKAIIGGAEFVAENYIAAGQDTLYEMKWNPAAPATHQYATHVRWAELQTNKMATIYNQLNSYIMIFDQPVFSDNLSPSERPIIDSGTSITNYPSGIVGVTTTNLNFRSGPSTSDSIIATLSANTKITIVGVNASNWYKIKVNGKEGWVSGTYVQIQNLLQIVNLDSSNLNIRSEPNTTSSIVGNLSIGELVSGVTDQDGNLIKDGVWYQIQFGNNKAWVHGHYISQIK